MNNGLKLQTMGDSTPENKLRHLPLHLHQLSCKIPQGRYASGRLALNLHEGRFEAV